MLLRECRRAWAAWERLASSRAGANLMFSWALAEAVAWPIIPEFLLFPMAVGARERFSVPLASSVIGSSIGGTLVYVYAWKRPSRALAALPRLPTVSERQIARASAALQAHGVAAFLAQPWSGVPLKVWAIVAGAQGLDPRLAIPTFIAGRATRMVLVAAFAGVLGTRLRSVMRDYSLYLAAAYAAVFFYGWRRIVR
jgi:1-acyl-sn-glycerol-3-phosphate acyltransferase